MEYFRYKRQFYILLTLRSNIVVKSKVYEIMLFQVISQKSGFGLSDMRGFMGMTFVIVRGDGFLQDLGNWDPTRPKRNQKFSRLNSLSCYS